MNTKGIKYGDIAEAFNVDMCANIDKIMSAKQKRDRVYYLLIMIKDGYQGPLAMGNNNELLHGVDKKQDRFRGETAERDFSDLKVAHCTIQVLEPFQVPNVPLIANILMKVDNKAGTIERVYALPPDIPIVDDGKSVENESVIRDSQGMPIVYGATN
jgi:hypothetical protein